MFPFESWATDVAAEYTHAESARVSNTPEGDRRRNRPLRVAPAAEVDLADAAGAERRVRGAVRVVPDDGGAGRRGGPLAGHAGGDDLPVRGDGDPERPVVGGRAEGRGRPPGAVERRVEGAV